MSDSNWIKRENSDREIYEARYEGNNVYGYVSKYPDNASWFWQAVRGDYRISDISPDCDEAMRCAKAALALPVSEFNQLVFKDLKKDLDIVVEKIVALMPDITEILPGWGSGYKRGVADMRGIMLETLNAFSEGGIK